MAVHVSFAISVAIRQFLVCPACSPSTIKVSGEFPPRKGLKDAEAKRVSENCHDSHEGNDDTNIELADIVVT